MTKSFESITPGKSCGVDEPSIPGGGSKSSSARAQPADGAWGQNNSHAGATDNNVVFLHPASKARSEAPYLDKSINLETLLIPFARFPGLKQVFPDLEAVCGGWSEFLDEVAPQPAPVITSKDKVPYYVAGTLKEAELVNQKIRERLIRDGKSTIGKQRSGAHIHSLGPALLFDDDGDVFSREPALRALGAAAAIYSSYSFGFLKKGATEPSRGGRVVLFLNRAVSIPEYGLIWDAINHLLGGGFDEHGRSSALCYGRHARRSDQAPFQRLILDGAALDAEALLELGNSLRPERSSEAQSQTSKGIRKRALIEELERAKLLGAVRPPNDYGEWWPAQRRTSENFQRIPKSRSDRLMLGLLPQLNTQARTRRELNLMK